jgi:hypothetical protein
MGWIISEIFDKVENNLIYAKTEMGEFFLKFLTKLKINLIYAKTTQVLPYHKPRFEILNGQSFSVKFYWTPKATLKP